MEESEGPNKAVIGVIVIVMIAAVGGGVLYLTQQDGASAEQSVVSSADTTQSTDTSSSTSSTSDNYTDGTYTSSVSFQTPDGIDGIEVTVVLANNVVTSVTATTDAGSRESQEYDDRFLASYESEVVGKSVDDVQLSRVAGASLTSNGFNNALDEIRQQAAA